jgi:hypothetical protein
MRNLLNKALVASAATLALASSAQAYVFVSLTDTSGGTVFCSTQTAATAAACGTMGFFGASGAGDGTVGFSGSVGGFMVNFSTVVSNSPGTATLGTLSNTSNVVQNVSSIGDLFIEVISYNYDAPAGLRLYSGSTSFGSANYSVTDAVTTVLTFDPSNGGGGNGDPGTTSFAATLNLPPPTGSTQSVNRDFAAQGVGASPFYSLRHVQAYDIAVGSTIDTFAISNVRRVPEPMTLSLVGVALLGAAVAARRRFTNM